MFVCLFLKLPFLLCLLACFLGLSSSLLPSLLFHCPLPSFLHSFPPYLPPLSPPSHLRSLPPYSSLPMPFLPLDHPSHSLFFSFTNSLSISPLLYNSRLGLLTSKTLRILSSLQKPINPRQPSLSPKYHAQYN